MSARSAHRPRHSRPRDGLTRAVLLEESGRFSRVGRLATRGVALLLALCVGALLVSLIAGNPVRGISNPLRWHDKQAAPATPRRLAASTPAALTTSVTAKATTAPASSPTATPAGRASAAGAVAPRSTAVRTSAVAPSRTPSPGGPPTTRPGHGRTHANTTHPRPTKTHRH